jgi:hypothetical protein
MPSTGAIDNSFVNNKGLLLFRMSGASHAFHTRVNFARSLFRTGILDHTTEGWVVLFRCVCSTYATLCRGPGLRTRPRLTQLFCGILVRRVGSLNARTHRCWRRPTHFLPGTIRAARFAKSLYRFAGSSEGSGVVRNRERPDRRARLPRRLPSALLISPRLLWRLRPPSPPRSASPGLSRD